MRSTLFVLLLTVALALPAQAQLRANAPEGPAPTALYETGGTPSLSSLFNAETLKISHSYEFSYSALGGGSLGLGVYTTTLGWQPSDRLAARVAVGVAHSPFGDSATQQALGFGQDTPARVFLQNAELAYRPTENSLLSIQVSQSPYGRYASPYGYSRYDPYGYAPSYGSSLNARYSTGSDALFWRNH